MLPLKRYLFDGKEDFRRSALRDQKRVILHPNRVSIELLFRGEPYDIARSILGHIPYRHVIKISDQCIPSFLVQKNIFLIARISLQSLIVIEMVRIDIRQHRNVRTFLDVLQSGQPPRRKLENHDAFLRDFGKLIQYTHLAYAGFDYLFSCCLADVGDEGRSSRFPLAPRDAYDRSRTELEKDTGVHFDRHAM